MAEPLIRTATRADAGGIAVVYADAVLRGTGTFEVVPPDAGEMARRMAEVAAGGWPWLVAGDAEGAVLGYAYARQFHPRAGYRHSCENSVYVAGGAAGRGIGGRLLAALIPAARDAGFTRMFAVIGDADNIASIRLHRRAGFRQVGRLEKVGVKFGREIDVVYMQAEIG